MIAGLHKLLALDPPVLHVDTGDPELDGCALRLPSHPRRARGVRSSTGWLRDRTSVHAELDAGARARAARCDRRAPTSSRCSPRSPPRTACRALSSCRRRSPPRRALRRHLLDLLAAERDLRAEPQLPRRRHLAAPRARDLRRDRAPQRVPDAGLGHAVLRSRPQPGLVRVHEPARRADRDGLRRPARLQLGLRRRPRRADGRAPDRPHRTCSCPDTIEPGAPRRDPHVLRRGRAAAARSRSSSSATTRRPAASTSTTSSGGSSRGRPPCSSTTRRTSAASSSARREIAALARSHGAETIVGVDPLSLGILAPPSDYGADIVVGSTQPLGVHMSCGGGAGGFIATRDDPRYAHEYPTLLLSIAETVAGRARLRHRALRADARTAAREEGNDWTGNSVYLWAVANAAYMALLGPEGFAELGRLIIARSHYAARRLARGRRACAIVFPDGLLQGVRRRLRRHRQDASPRSTARCAPAASSAAATSRASFPELGQSALYCVTEVHIAGRHRPARQPPWPRWSHDAPPLPRGRLGRAARAGAGRARAARRRLRRGRVRDRATVVGDPTRSCPSRLRRDAPADAAGAVRAGGAAPLPPPLAGDARDDGRQPLRHVHDEVQPAARDRARRRGPRSPSCIPTRTTRRCRAFSSSCTGST